MRVCLALAVAVLLGRAMHGQAAAEAPPFFDVRPGLSTRAEVDLRLGEPVEKLPPAHGYPRFRYAPPRGAAEVDRVVVEYFADSWQVARIDVLLTPPLPADTVREQFGARIVTQDRPEGGREELYFPRLQALVFAGKDTGTASAIGYLSPRAYSGAISAALSAAMRASRPGESPCRPESRSECRREATRGSHTSRGR